MAHIWQYPNVVSSSGGNHDTVRRAYVDNVYGNDTTAVLDNQHRPFASVQAAIDALGLTYNGESCEVVVYNYIGAGNIYNYTSTYTFPRLRVVLHHFVSVIFYNIPATILSVVVHGANSNIAISNTTSFCKRIYVTSSVFINAIALAQVLFETEVFISVKSTNCTLSFVGNYESGTAFQNRITIANSQINRLDYNRTGEIALFDELSINNTAINRLSMNYYSLLNTDSLGLQNRVILRNSNFGLLDTIINLQTIPSERYHYLIIDNCIFDNILNISVYGSIRATNSSFSALYQLGSNYPIIYASQPSSNSYVDETVDEAYRVVFNNCVFGRIASESDAHYSPALVMDVPLYSLEHCVFYIARSYDGIEPFDLYRFLIWDTNFSTNYGRKIDINYCKFYTNVDYSGAITVPVSGVVWIRGSENIYNNNISYNIEHVRVSTKGLIDNFIVIDENNTYAPYISLSALPFRAVTTTGNNGSYEIYTSYSRMEFLNNSVIVGFILSTLSSSIRDFHNTLYVSGNFVHNVPANFSLYIYGCESNGLYGSAPNQPIWGDSKQVIKTLTSGSYIVNVDDKTIVLGVGFVGPITLISVLNYYDYKEIIIVNNSGIPITINPQPGEFIDSFTSVTIGVNQRMVLKRVSNTEYAII